MKPTGTITRVADMQAWSEEKRACGQRVALVPTMGYLHAGHCSLLKLARQQADQVVMSLFVNPTQFGPGEDYARYPRDTERDLNLAAEYGVDVVFMPSTEEMYPDGSIHFVDASDVVDTLEGEYRPGHFRGVLTIVAKLFLAVHPHAAVFGEKDAQQWWLIQKMVKDLNFPIKLISGPTIREPDGLALSSRNTYLSPEHRKQAVALSRGLKVAQALHQKGESNAYILRQHIWDAIAEQPDAQIDYVEIVSQSHFAPVTLVQEPCLALVAARFGQTRLIDNIALN